MKDINMRFRSSYENWVCKIKASTEVFESSSNDKKQQDIEKSLRFATIRKPLYIRISTLTSSL